MRCSRTIRRSWRRLRQHAGRSVRQISKVGRALIRPLRSFPIQTMVLGLIAGGCALVFRCATPKSAFAFLAQKAGLYAIGAMLSLGLKECWGILKEEFACRRHWLLGVSAILACGYLSLFSISLATL